jgi:hypothetical protein
MSESLDTLREIEARIPCAGTVPEGTAGFELHLTKNPMQTR